MIKPTEYTWHIVLPNIRWLTAPGDTVVALCGITKDQYNEHRPDGTGYQHNASAIGDAEHITCDGCLFKNLRKGIL